MTDSLLYKFIDEDFGIEGRGKWYHSDQHDSLVYNSEDDFFFWNSRGIKGNALDYLILVRGMDKEQASNFLKNSYGAFKENKPDGVRTPPYEKLVELMWNNGKKNRDYWYHRKLTDSTIDRYKLGFYEGWYLIPMYENGEFANFQCRRDEPKKTINQWYRHGHPILFNEGILPFTKTIYITEGTVDAILLNQEGFPAVSPNGTNTWQISWFSKFTHIENIYYVEDHDAAGRNGSKLVANCLGLDRVKIVSFDDKPDKYDSVDFFRDGGTKETYKDWISTHSRYLFQMENTYTIKQKKATYQWARSY